jgi:hypothetical protein
VRVATVDRPWPTSRNTRATNHPRTPGWVKYSVLDDIIDVTGREFAGSMTYGGRP